MGNRITWPPLRTDVMALICVALAFYAIAKDASPAIAVAAIVGAVFCAISPRMKGPFGYSGGGGTRIGGEFMTPREEMLVSSEQLPRGPLQLPERSSRESDAD